MRIEKRIGENRKGQEVKREKKGGTEKRKRKRKERKRKKTVVEARSESGGWEKR